MALSPGSILGPYEILLKIGSGGMGEVYCARDPRLGRKVAIKILLPAFAADPERLSRFEQETRGLALLNHPNILHIYDTGMHEGSPFLVMEYLEGENLRDRLNGRAMPVRKAVEVARQIAMGLAAAHEKGITHRDLKPENIFLTTDERVKILDFGLAKLRVVPTDQPETQGTMPVSPTLTEAGMVVGTVGYLSPEQVLGKSADPRSDIFSLGVLLWEMLHGSRPFRGASAVETMHAILKDEPQESMEIPGLPEELQRIVRRCVEKEPRARFQSAQDLAFDLESLRFTSLSQKIVPVRPRFSRRNLVWTAGILGFLAVGGLGFWAGNHGQKPPSVQFQRITYQSGRILNARFGPDGQTYVVSVSQSGGARELRTGRLDGLGTRPLEMPPGAQVLSVSSKGDMALLLEAEPGGSGILARAPLGGGAPRPVLEGVFAADWAPDGERLAVVRESAAGARQVEYPIGHLVFEAPSGSLVESLRVSPDGERVAFSVIHAPGIGELRVVDRSGHSKILLKGQCDSLAWEPKGKEILHVLVCQDDRRELRAVNLSGRSRSLHAVLGSLVVCDVSPQGRVLVEHSLTRRGVLVRNGDDAAERDFSWLQSSVVSDLMADGSGMLFGELCEGKDVGGAYLRRFDKVEAIRLGDGDPLSLSPDGRWALVHDISPEGGLSLLPTGPGSAHRILASGLRLKWGAFLRDDRRLLVAAVDGAGHFGYYVQQIDTGAVQALNWEAAPEAYMAVAPDGDHVAVGAVGGKVRIYSLAGKPVRELAGFESGEEVLQWSADGLTLFTVNLSGVPACIYRVELATGRRTLWKKLGSTGASGIHSVCLSPDAKTYAYSYSQVLTSDLYLMDGWK